MRGNSIAWYTRVKFISRFLKCNIEKQHALDRAVFSRHFFTEEFELNRFNAIYYQTRLYQVENTEGVLQSETFFRRLQLQGEMNFAFALIRCSTFLFWRVAEKTSKADKALFSLTSNISSMYLHELYSKGSFHISNFKTC